MTTHIKMPAKKIRLFFNFIRLISINVFIGLILIMLIETACYIARASLGRQNVGFLYQKSDPIMIALKDNCERFRTHPYYGHIHDHNNKCDLKNGRISGPFVFYGSPHNKDAILTLGGSTTDGFYQSFNNGETWPFILNNLIDYSKKPYFVINAGTGAYGSSQELLKLLVDGARLANPIKYVVSLNGINDVAGYRLPDERYEKLLPFWGSVNFRMFSLEKYIKQDESAVSIFLPSTMTLIIYLARLLEIETNKNNTAWQNSIMMQGEGDIKSQNVEEQWFYNVRMMHAISKEIGAKFFVFLQPTMGLKGNQIPQDKTSKDYSLYQSMGEPYLKEINSHYEILRSYCSKLNYCYDISNIAPPSGNNYHDPRHHNAAGNNLIAKKIYSEIFIANPVNEIVSN